MRDGQLHELEPSVRRSAGTLYINFFNLPFRFFVFTGYILCLNSDLPKWYVCHSFWVCGRLTFTYPFFFFQTNLVLPLRVFWFSLSRNSMRFWWPPRFKGWVLLWSHQLSWFKNFEQLLANVKLIRTTVSLVARAWRRRFPKIMVKLFVVL